MKGENNLDPAASAAARSAGSSSVTSRQGV
jgi:hypothetical protein